jgi:medium-chain acyl-[acyl-carrier-protein] hydrolase
MLEREDRFTVKAFDCRPDGGMKVNALMQYLQETAACHAEQLGVGFADMNQRDCFWVLANLRIEISREPKWRDSLLIRTWPSGYTRLIASREFIGLAPDGGEWFRAGSEWMVLDRQSGRPRNLTRLDLNLPPSGPKALSTPLDRLKGPEGCTGVCSQEVPFSSLDFNGHVNNTEYVRWATDALYRQLGRACPIHTMQVTYLAEAFQGDRIDALISAGGAGRFRVLERRAGEPAGADVCLVEVICPTSSPSPGPSRRSGQ